MLCAHTVRRLKPGTFDAFAEAFGPPEESGSVGWVRFHMLRSLADPDQVVTFGFFDGTLEDLERSQDKLRYADQQAAIAPFVDEILVNGVYEIALSKPAEAATA